MFRQFYTDAHCKEFFKSRQERYRQAEKTYNAGLTDIDTAWFVPYYGVKSEDTFRIIIGLGNGGMCYGPTVEHPDYTKDIFSIMGAWKFDGDGNPVFSREMVSTVVHEFCHSYANPCIDRHEPELRETGLRIFGEVAPEMCRMGYSLPTIVFYESLVRVSTIRYLINHGCMKEACDLNNADINNGFRWISKLVKLLETYESDRNTYPTMDSFMPRIVRFFDEEVAGQIDRWPHLISIGEFKNEDQQVDPGLKTLTVRFNRPMCPKIGFFTGQLGIEHYPVKN